MIKVKRDSDGKIFTNDMREEDVIYEIHFCDSYTQVLTQEMDEKGKLRHKGIICEPLGTKANFIDLIATQGEETGTFV